MIKYLSEERGEYYDHTGKPTSREAAFEMMDQCVMYMGAEETLDALVRALGADDVCDAFAYIFRNYEIPYPGEEEDEDELYESKSRKRRMKESYESTAIDILNKIRAEDDGIARFATLQDMTYSYCLVPYCNPEDVGTGYRGDIARCLEYTLHELLDSGMENQLWVMGAFKRDYDDEVENELDDLEEIISIDLDYFIFAPSSFEVIECGASV